MPRERCVARVGAGAERLVHADRDDARAIAHHRGGDQVEEHVPLGGDVTGIGVAVILERLGRQRLGARHDLRRRQARLHLADQRPVLVDLLLVLSRQARAVAQRAILIEHGVDEQRVAVRHRRRTTARVDDQAIEQIGPPTRVMSAVTIQAVSEPFIRRRAIRHLEKKRIVVLAAGTGNPFFTTDTASVLRALELQCEVIIKATKVDGEYDSDPAKNPTAKRYESRSFNEAISNELGVMDQTAFTMCREHSLPVIVLSIHEPGTIAAAARGEQVGTLVTR